MFHLLISTIFSSYEPSLDQVKHLMSVHQYWDASFLLTTFIGDHALPKYVLLRAECFLKSGEFKLSLRDAYVLIHGKSWFAFSSKAPEITLEVQPSKIEIAQANILAAQANIELGEYQHAQVAAKDSGNATLKAETDSLVSIVDEAEKYAKTHDFQESVALYDRLVIRSPKSISLLLRRAVLTSLSRNHSYYAELSAELPRKFPSQKNIKETLGLISFCNCGFEESRRWIQLAQTSYNNWWERLPQRLAEGRRVDDWLNRRQTIERNFTETEKAFSPLDLEKASRGMEKLLSEYKEICWKGSVFTDRLFMLHIKLLNAIGENNDSKLEILSRYIHDSPKLIDLYLERAQVHAENQDLEASKYDLQMVEKLRGQTKSEKRNQQDGSGI